MLGIDQIIDRGKKTPVCASNRTEGPALAVAHPPVLERMKEAWK